MNEFRRGLLVVYGLLLVAACLAVIGLAWDEGRQFDIDLTNFRSVAYVEVSGGARLAFTFFLALVAFVGLLSVFIALLPSGARARSLRVTGPGGEQVEITVSALEMNLREEVEGLPDVVQAWPRVRLGGKAVHTENVVSIQPGANIAYVTGAVAHTAMAMLREQAAPLDVRRPSISVNAAAPPEGGQAGAGPPAAPETAAAPATGYDAYGARDD